MNLCRRIGLITALAFLTVVPVSSQDAQQAPPQMRLYVVGLIYRGLSWSQEATPEEEELQAGHRANIDRLVESGEMVLAGPFGDGGDLRGLFLYNVETLEAARALVNSDPRVKAGRLRVELHPWWGPKALEHLLADQRS